MAISERDKPPKISVRELTKVFGPHPNQVLEHIDREWSKEDILAETGHVVGVREASFEVRTGEIFVTMGLSGSGKSTLIRMLNRLIEPTRGEVLIDDADITQMPLKALIELRRRDISMVFQSFALMPHLTVFENAAFGLDVAGIREPERGKKVERALETVGLSAYAHHRPAELSGGMQQRVGLARALTLEPTIMLMDEAFSALDPLIRTEMQDELLTIQSRHGITVVFVSHDLNEAFRIGDRLAIMDEGAIVQIGTPRDLVLEPANDRIRSFLSEADVRQVLTARDLAIGPPVEVTEREAMDLEHARTRLESAGELFLYAVDPEGDYRGVASRDSIRAAREGGKTRLSDAFLDDIITLPPEQPFAEMTKAVADARAPVPVVDAAGRMLGVVTPAAMLRASGGEG